MNWLVRCFAALFVLLLLLAGVFWWLAASESGLRWAAQIGTRFTGGKLELVEPRGAIAGTMMFDRIAYALEGMKIEAYGVKVATLPRTLFDRRLSIDELHIDRLVLVQSAVREQPRKPATKPTLPESIALPLQVRVASASVGTLEFTREGNTTRVRNLFVSYEAGIRRHRIGSLRADTDFGYVGAAGWIETTRPFVLDVAAALDRPGGAQPPATPLDMAANVRVHLDGTLRDLAARAQGSLAQMRADVRAKLAPFDQPWPELLRSVDVDATPIDAAQLAPALPHTAITLRVKARGNGGRIVGDLQANNAHAGLLDKKQLPIKSITTRFHTDFASGRLEKLVIGLAPGGSLTGDGELQANPLTARLDVNVEHLDLRSFGSTLRTTALDGPLRIVVQGPQEQTLVGTLTQQDMRIGASVRRNGEIVEVTDLQLGARGGSASGKARLQLAGPTPFEAQLQFKRFDPARFGAFPAGDINGTANAKGALGEKRRIDGRWIIANSRLRGRSLASRGTARLVGERVEQLDASARLGSNEVVARGSFGGANDRVQWRVNAPALAEIADALAGSVQASGTLSGAPDRLRAELVADARQLRLPAGVSIQSARVEGRGGMRPDAPFAIRLNAQQVASPQIALDKVAFDTSGTRARHEARLQAGAGSRALDLSVRGAWSGQLPGKWVGEVASASLRGALPGNATVQLVSPAPLAVAADDISLRDLKIAVNGDKGPEASFQVLDLRWQPGRLATRGGFEHLSTRWLQAFVEMPPGMETTVAFAGEWSIRSDPRLNGTLSIRREDGDVRFAGPPAIDAGLSQAVFDARFDEGRIAAELAVTAKLAKLQARTTIAPAPGATGFGITPASALTFSTDLDVAEVRLFTEPLLTVARVSGRVAANLRGSGTLGAPRIDGTIAADSVGVVVPPYGIDLSDGRLRAQLAGDNVQVNELTIRGGDGSFDASGTLPLRPAAGVANVAWRAERLRLLNRPDMRLVVNGKGDAAFADQRFALRGALAAESGHFELARQALPQPGEDVAILGQEEKPARGAAKTPLDLDLQVDLGKQLSLRGYGLDGKATGQIRLTTTSTGELRAAGRVMAVDSKFRAYGQQLVVDPGNLVFDGRIDNPSLDITAWRRNQQVEAGVQLSGTARAPRVTLVSRPEVPEGERLSWLVLGRPPGDAAGADLALLQAAGGALLGGGDSVPMTQKIANSIGLDELAVRSSSEIASSVVAVGKRLSEKLLITYEHGLDAAAENLVRLDYSLTRRISLRAETGTTTGFGIFYRFAWD
jgi:translocation and assembly module TamB